MTVADLIQKGYFRAVNQGEELDRPVTGVFCCDLLSVAMGRAPADFAWVTVMGNVNTVAVATLADVSCMILAEGTVLDEMGRKKAKEQGVTVLSTEEPVFEAALKVYRAIGEAS